MKNEIDTREFASAVLVIEEMIEQLQRDGAALPFRRKINQIAGIADRAKSFEERFDSLGDRVSRLGVGIAVAHGYDSLDPTARLGQYFIENVGVVLDGRELAVVSGISEFARRVRELRVEQGYRILTGASNDPDAGVSLRPDNYLLVSIEPDEANARRWLIANRIRKAKGGSKSRILQFLQEMVGQIVTTEELAYIGGGAKEFARRVRELRTEEGYAISTRSSGRPDLKMGEYVLSDLERRAEAHDRHVPMEIQKEVYARDDNRCRLCGWKIEQWSRSDPRILELHHFQHHEAGGSNTSENLLVLCSKCHDDVHAGRRHSPKPVD